MKRALLTLGFTALLATPAAAQWLGMPVWNSPKGGTGVTISGDYGKPNATYGAGNAFGGRASVGLRRRLGPSADLRHGRSGVFCAAADARHQH